MLDFLVFLWQLLPQPFNFSQTFEVHSRRGHFFLRRSVRNVWLLVRVRWSFSGFGHLLWCYFRIDVRVCGFFVRIIFFAFEDNGLMVSKLAKVEFALAEFRSVLVLFYEGLGRVYLNPLFIKVFFGGFTFLFVLNNFVLLPYKLWYTSAFCSSFPFFVVRFEQSRPIFCLGTELIEFVEGLFFRNGWYIGDLTFENVAFSFSPSLKGLAVSLIVFLLFFWFEEGFAFVNFVATYKV